MSSTQALDNRNFASVIARAMRMFSRCSHSASTSRPSLSSKDSFALSGFFCCSVHAATSAVSFSASGFSSVG